MLDKCSYFVVYLTFTRLVHILGKEMPTMEMPPKGILAGSVAADYAKRLLDQHGYDHVIALARRHGLIPRSTVGKAGTELLAFVVGGITDYNMGEDSLMAKFFKEVISDVPSELAKRIYDGEEDPLQLMLPGLQQPEQPRNSLVNVLAALDAENRDQVLLLMEPMDTKARQSFIRALTGMSKSDLEQLKTLTPEQRQQILSVTAGISAPFRLQPLARLDKAANTLAEGLFPWTKKR